jgi:hypothetical protein
MKPPLFLLFGVELLRLRALAQITREVVAANATRWDSCKITTHLLGGLAAVNLLAKVATIECQTSLSRQHIKQVICTRVCVGSEGIPRLEYWVDGPALQKLCATYLAKNILISNRDQWTDEQIIRAYRSQYLIEAVFKVMKDRRVGTWWPLNHWTDWKIRVHALYCTIGHLLRGVMHRRIKQVGVQISLPRLMKQKLLSILQITDETGC